MNKNNITSNELNNNKNKQLQKALKDSMTYNRLSNENLELKRALKESMKYNTKLSKENLELQKGIEESLKTNPPLNPPPSFKVEPMKRDGYCGYYAILKYCNLNNMTLFHKTVPYKDYPVELFIEDIRKALTRELSNKNIEKKGNIFISLHNKNKTNKLTVKDNIESLIARTYADRSNTLSWLDTDFIRVISYYTNKCFLIFNNMDQIWRVIKTEGIDCNDRTMIFLIYNGTNHFDLLIPKLNTQNEIRNFYNLVNEYRNV